MQGAVQFVFVGGMACCLFLTGCGGPTGPKTVPASGSVTYKGEKIKVGTVSFAPKDAKVGRAATAEIKDGAYQTVGGQGLMTGEYKITVTGFKRPLYEIDPKDLKSQAENNAVPKKYTDLKTTDLTVTVSDKDGSIKKDLELKD